MPEPLHTIGGEPLIPGVDLAGLALRTLAFGASLGAALECLVLWGTRAMTAGAQPSDTPEIGGAFYLLTLGTMTAMAAAGGTSWAALGPVGSPWRRAGLSAISAFATLVAAAAAVPLDVNFGPASLLGAAVILGLLAFIAGRKVLAWYAALP